jgi:uncharacterized protein with HEPN domain
LAKLFVSKGRAYALERMGHIAVAAEAIAAYTSRGRQAFDDDSTIRDAILYQMVVIGEAAKAVIAADADIASDVPNIEWSLWAKMRDRITHQYWAIDHDIVWSTASSDVQELRAKVDQAMERLRV